MENLQNKYARLDIRKYTKPEIDIILELGNFDEITKEVFKRLNNGDTIVKISMDLTDKNKYGYVSIKRVNKAIKEIKKQNSKINIIRKIKVNLRAQSRYFDALFLCDNKITKEVE